ncbi:hypothetical protein E2C01_033150 [Portunus trituberculatus]|uniref:Uncharacterized protein n=1 Tax=Portunus trituberculatus TaxID=210409 RepID=A0A5B7F380_PORTR|nr:hypothetical protein [Portunus trituberculatus]
MLLLPAPPWLLPPLQPPSKRVGGSARVLKPEPPCPALLGDTRKQRQHKTSSVVSTDMASQGVHVCTL